MKKTRMVTADREELCDVQLTRKEILALPIELRRKMLERQVDQVAFEDLKMMD